MHTSEGYCRNTFWDVVETPSLCDLGHQCPNSICPEELPGEEDACDIHQVVKCHYDKVECCDGSVEFSITAICSDHKWMLEMLPTYCDLSCHDDDQHSAVKEQLCRYFKITIIVLNMASEHVTQPQLFGSQVLFSVILADV